MSLVYVQKWMRKHRINKWINKCKRAFYLEVIPSGNTYNLATRVKVVLFS